MANKRIEYLSGKGKWIKTTMPNKYGDWSVDLYLDEQSKNKFKAMKAEGLKNSLKRDDEGDFVTLKRPTQKIIGGKVRAFTPPLLLAEDGTTPLTVYAGNGSDLTVKLEVYGPGTKNGGWGIATRLESIRVDNLVPFKGTTDFDKDQSQQISGLAEQPAPNF